MNHYASRRFWEGYQRSATSSGESGVPQSCCRTPPYHRRVSPTSSTQPRSERAQSRMPAPFYRWRPHPWHGIDVGPEPPSRVHAFVEMTPFDMVKYEVDKATGYMKCDRPQRSSSLPPTLYGFIPRTYCGERVGALSTVPGRGDGDPLDICIISERPITRAEVILTTRVVGAIRMVDRGEVDDKIVAVLENDPVWQAAREIGDLPQALVERLQHYFTYYKLMPGETGRVEVNEALGRAEAEAIVKASIEDYTEAFG